MAEQKRLPAPISICITPNFNIVRYSRETLSRDSQHVKNQYNFSILRSNDALTGPGIGITLCG